MGWFSSPQTQAKKAMMAAQHTEREYQAAVLEMRKINRLLGKMKSEADQGTGMKQIEATLEIYEKEARFMHERVITFRKKLEGVEDRIERNKAA